MDLVLEGKIAQGGYGVVYQALYNQEKVAAKEITKPASLNPLEVVIQRSELCPGIMTIEETITDKQSIFFLEELGQADLQRWRYQHPKLSFSQIKAWVGDLLVTLAKLHQLGIVHGDIKPSNVIVTTNLEVKLNDFGLCEYEHWLDRRSGMCTRNYRPPEVWLGEKRNCKVDIWSMGCLIYFLLVGEDLFHDEKDSYQPYLQLIAGWSQQYHRDEIDRQSVVSSLRQYKPVRPTYRLDWKHSWHELVVDMLHPDPEKRPSAEDILDKYFEPDLHYEPCDLTECYNSATTYKWKFDLDLEAAKLLETKAQTTPSRNHRQLFALAAYFYACFGQIYGKAAGTRCKLLVDGSIWLAYRCMYRARLDQSLFKYPLTKLLELEKVIYRYQLTLPSANQLTIIEEMFLEG